MATDTGVTRPRVDGDGASLLCGKPGCDRVAEVLFSLEWADWTGLIGSCWEHHEDLAVRMLQNEVKDFPPEMGRD